MAQFNIVIAAAFSAQGFATRVFPAILEFPLGGGGPQLRAIQFIPFH
jgi:hypothetical protein